MYSKKALFFILSFIITSCVNNPENRIENLADYVDPFIGTAYTGHTHPSASLPFSMVQVGPDTGIEGWEYCAARFSKPIMETTLWKGSLITAGNHVEGKKTKIHVALSTTSWDTYRALNPYLNLVFPGENSQFVKSMLERHRQLCYDQSPTFWKPALIKKPCWPISVRQWM